MAEAIYSNRAHVNDVLNNKPGHGYQTRRKLIVFFKKEFPKAWPEILEALNWTTDSTDNADGKRQRTAAVQNLAESSTSDVPRRTK